jgi:long-chain fatty acid transport protein
MRAASITSRAGGRGAALLCALLLAALAPAAAHAAGYAIYEQSPSVLGMAGAGVASVSDASAIFFNPAVLTRLEGSRLLVGASVLSPVTSFAGMDPYPGYGVTEEMKHQHFFPPTIYFTRHGGGPWAIGAGLNSPYGLGVEWKNPDTFSGRYIVTKGTLRTFDGTLDLAFAPTSQWSVAAGASVLFTDVELDRHVLVPAPGGGGAQVDVAKVNLDGDLTPGYGWNAALSFAPAPALKFGAAYHGKVVVHLDGRANITQIPTGNAAFDAGVAASLPPSQGVTTVLRFPAVWSAGLAWQPQQEWTVEGDFNFVEWSLFRDLPIYFHQTPSANETIVEDYDDSWQVRFGAEHRLATWTYRFGWYFDKAAAPTTSVSPLLPDADRNGPSLGIGIPFGHWTVDAYELPLFVKRRSTAGVNRDGFDGTYKTFVNLAGVGVQVHW